MSDLEQIEAIIAKNLTIRERAGVQQTTSLSTKESDDAND